MLSQQEGGKVTAENPGEDKARMEMGNETETQESSSWRLQQRTTQRGERVTLGLGQKGKRRHEVT